MPNLRLALTPLSSDTTMLFSGYYLCGHTCQGRYCLNEETMSEAWAGEEALEVHVENVEVHPECNENCASLKKKGMRIIPIPSGVHLTKILSAKRPVSYFRAEKDSRGVTMRFVDIPDRQAHLENEPNLIGVTFIPDPHFSTTAENFREESSYVNLGMNSQDLIWIHNACPEYVYCLDPLQQDFLISGYMDQGLEEVEVKIWGPVRPLLFSFCLLSSVYRVNWKSTVGDGGTHEAE